MVLSKTKSGRVLTLATLVPAAASWSLLWTVDSYWNPLFFTGLWVGATVVMYALGPAGYPGVRRHAVLAAASIPLWWWFEAVNARVDNWVYVKSHDYGDVEYVLLTSLAFSTVVPALHSAWSLAGRFVDAQPSTSAVAGWPRFALAGLIAVGIAAQTLVFLAPTLFFPLVWVAPFLVLDGVAGRMGGRSLVLDAAAKRYGVALQVAAGGLLCGFLWEFWNFWATPKWLYEIPGVDWLHVFEMPVLGYGGYVPFAWAVYQVVQVTGLGARRLPDGWARRVPVRGRAAAAASDRG